MHHRGMPATSNRQKPGSPITVNELFWALRAQEFKEVILALLQTLRQDRKKQSDSSAPGRFVELRSCNMGTRPLSAVAFCIGEGFLMLGMKCLRAFTSCFCLGLGPIIAEGAELTGVGGIHRWQGAAAPNVANIQSMH